MCARWPTIAMSKLFFLVWTKLLPLHGCDVMRFGVMCLWFDLLSSDVASCEVICGTTPTCYSCTTTYYCTTRYYSSTNSVIQSTTPILLCTTKYYSSTTLYYKVLRHVLLCTTKCYNVLLQYYSLLQSTTPVLLCATKYYSSTTPLLQSTTLQYYNVVTTSRNHPAKEEIARNRRKQSFAVTISCNHPAQEELLRETGDNKASP